MVSLLMEITQWHFGVFLSHTEAVSSVCFVFFSPIDNKGDFKIKEFTLNGASTLCRCCLSSMVSLTCNILLINSNRKGDVGAWHQVVGLILSLLCALCPLSALCHLFWCSNLSQVNIILCCLKLCVGNKKGLRPFVESTCLWLFTPLLPALRLTDKVIIRGCFLPAITFCYNGSNTGKADGVGRRQG